MSKRTGDRAKFNKEHKKRMQRRKRIQELRQTLTTKASETGARIPGDDGKPIVTSRLRQLTGDLKADSMAFEIVLYQAAEGEKND